MALREGRLLLTEDKDFGQLVYAAGRATGWVILLRFPASARSQIAQTVLALVTQRGEQLLGRFVVAQHGRVRISSQFEDRSVGLQTRAGKLSHKKRPKLKLEAFCY